MKYMAVEQHTRLDDGFYMTAASADEAARSLEKRYGGLWMVEDVPDVFPARKDRFHASYSEEKVKEFIGRAMLTPE